MSGKTGRRVPEERAASAAEIKAAIEGLTEADTQRLLRYAERRIWCVGRGAAGKIADDLLQEAMTDLLSDTRRWDRSKVGFLQFLFGAMKSISSNWAKSYKPEEFPLSATELRQTNDSGEESNPYDAHADPSPSVDRSIEFREKIGQIDKLFADDPEAQQVLEAWKEGFDPAGVRELWSMTQKEYDTVVRRIRRRITSAGITADLSKGSQYVH